MGTMAHDQIAKISGLFAKEQGKPSIREQLSNAKVQTKTEKPSPKKAKTKDEPGL
jgi:hypothetical protein